jgi:MFS transporter, DHA1 family, inner membrane transport protein
MNAAESAPSGRFSSLRLHVAVFAAVRMVVNISTRMIYPFLNTFASGLGVDLTTISLVMTSRSAAGALSPFITPVADKRGRKVSMLLGLGMFTASSFLLLFWPTLLSFFISVNLSFLGMYVYVSSMEAYLGDTIRQNRRGLAMAFVEWGWAFAFIFGMPLVGFALDRYGWLAPFPLLGVLGLISMGVIAVVIPNHKPAAAPNGMMASIKQVLRSPAARSLLLMGLLLVAANEVINLVFGVWLETSFGFKLAALGAASVIIGISELVGELSGGVLSDRIGRKRSIWIGLSFIVVVAAALPFIGRSQFGAVAGLFLFYLAFEFAFVAAQPLLTEIVPEARATMMGVNKTAVCLGRMVGNLISPFLFALGFWANCAAAIVLVILAAITLLGVKEKAS